MARLDRQGSGNWAMGIDGTDGMAREVRVWMRTINRLCLLETREYADISGSID